jgi:hypothetical protein
MNPLLFILRFGEALALFALAALLYVTVARAYDSDDWSRQYGPVSGNTYGSERDYNRNPANEERDSYLRGERDRTEKTNQPTVYDTPSQSHSYGVEGLNGNKNTYECKLDSVSQTLRCY